MISGAGKSSLVQSLFRLVDDSSTVGSIFIDGIDIRTISLDDLRSRLSLIPQNPILFSGTLRYNIDPLGQFSDEQCFSALESVQMKEFAVNHPNGLDLFIGESGSNLSVGQRQLICIARAILKKSQILLIDEGTANVDYQTDQIIQQVISQMFSDRTILTIAHRLNTIRHCHRILILEQGQVVYFDKPENIPQGYFS